MTLNHKQICIVYSSLLFLCFMPFISPVIALALGILLSILGIKQADFSKYTSFSLQASIVLMGFGMNLAQVISTSKTGFIDTAISVFVVMTCGLLLGKFLKVDSKISLLISAGTAICGGSAIAAIAPVSNAKNSQISFALVVVFILNAVALIIFPLIGHYFNLSQETFGYWAAIAIHDTSSVVGAGATYGVKALEIATTVKLIRALWIIPLSIVVAVLQKDKSVGKLKFPWFIGLFVISILISYLLPAWDTTYTHLNWLGRRGMVVALFLIGSNISIAEAKQAGLRSFILGILLWLLIGIGSFLMLTSNF
ncbi:putative sulfate exporter family transporter [Ancylomarina euxinus]|uniref:Putative sulfate exporter family transporter n=2 Tax=Ancylomarina euxinus TaxID=2283627 RepID=A0A425XZQ5_9BACT|nr:putative sulfate exporter family transporter [Ancylomarina euxinus]MUP15630.1 putative sulfate exporter family transporter [Ancylomarina euxinus]RRG20931.1 putative sulfate exporter family transporter [Ancylomarina euxinus]